MVAIGPGTPRLLREFLIRAILSNGGSIIHTV